MTGFITGQGRLLLGFWLAMHGLFAAQLQPTPAAGPPPSAGHALVFHDSLKSVLLVNAGLGGMKSPPASTRTFIWRWTGQAWVVVDSMGPPVRNLGGVAYDSRRDALVLFGGSYDQHTVYDETWEWSRKVGWMRKSAAGPGRRDHTDMAYDPVSGRVILFGGQIASDSFPADTWTWDGVSWTRRVQSQGPSARIHHSIVYDPKGQRVLMFGGVLPPRTGLGDTWAWSGSEWRSVAAPWYPRSHSRLAITSRGVVMIGGIPPRSSSSIPLLGDSAWRSEEQPNNPAARYLTAVAFDHLRGVTVLFGGGGPPGDSLYDDTWEHHPLTGWRQVSNPAGKRDSGAR